ncbi:hypothetical protein LEP1GSC083_3035, partial [Leptospira interrogans serovar Pyrogenes str. L0374]
MSKVRFLKWDCLKVYYDYIINSPIFVMKTEFCNKNL